MLRKFKVHVKRNKRFYAILAFTLITSLSPGTAYADQFTAGGQKLIGLITRLEGVLATVVSIWGIVEWQLGYPGWKQRVMAGILGYIACLLIPSFFAAIEAAVGH